MAPNRRTIRYAAAGASTAIAALYFLIGLGVLRVVDGSPGDPSMLAFGASAGAAFLLGAVLLLAFDDRRLWVLGLILQILVAWGYVSVAPQRTPPFEAWGITLRVLQLPLLVALAYLTLRAVERADVRARPARRAVLTGRRERLPHVAPPTAAHDASAPGRGIRRVE